MVKTSLCELPLISSLLIKKERPTADYICRNKYTYIDYNKRRNNEQKIWKNVIPDMWTGNIVDQNWSDTWRSLWGFH